MCFFGTVRLWAKRDRNFCLHFAFVYVSASHAFSAWRAQQRMLDTLKLELQMSVSCHVHARNWTCVLRKISQCSYLTIHPRLTQSLNFEIDKQRKKYAQPSNSNAEAGEVERVSLFLKYLHDMSPQTWHHRWSLSGCLFSVSVMVSVTLQADNDITISCCCCDKLLQVLLPKTTQVHYLKFSSQILNWLKIWWRWPLFLEQD